MTQWQIVSPLLNENVGTVAENRHTLTQRRLKTVPAVLRNDNVALNYFSRSFDNFKAAKYEILGIKAPKKPLALFFIVNFVACLACHISLILAPALAFIQNILGNYTAHSLPFFHSHTCQSWWKQVLNLYHFSFHHSRVSW